MRRLPTFLQRFKLNFIHRGFLGLLMGVGTVSMDIAITILRDRWGRMHKVVTVKTVAMSLKIWMPSANTPGYVQKEGKICNYLKSITMSVRESDRFRLSGISVQFPHLLLTILVYTLRRKNPSKLSSEPRNGMETMSSAVHWNPLQLL